MKKKDKSPFKQKYNQNRDGFKKHKKGPPYANKSTISVEFLLKKISKCSGSIDLEKIINELKLNSLSQKDLLSKATILEKIGLLTHTKGYKYNINNHKLKNELYEYVIISIKKILQNNHYFVHIQEIHDSPFLEDEFIINNLKPFHKGRILVKLTIENEKIVASPVFYLREPNNTSTTKSPFTVLKGIFRKIDGTPSIIPINFRSRNNIILEEIPTDLPEGSLISATFIDSNNTKVAKFKNIIANHNIAKSLSMLSVYQYDIPFEFSEDIINEATKFNLPPSPENRLDIRNIPLVTIDDDDAKDFDDAIYAEPLENGSYLLYVAIADVSYYVEINSALDKEAKKRGNSIYLPGFVIPMLPKELSNGWCSLNPKEERGCILAKITINRNGIIENFSFHRALMKSAARLTYKEVQEALDDKNISTNIKDVLDKTVRPCFQAFKLLNKAKEKRHPLNITSQETKIVLDKDDNLLDVVMRPHYTSHDIVEEFMIAANVAAAKFIGKSGNAKKQLCIYRVHNKPSADKINDFIKVVKSFHISVPNVKTDNIYPIFFNDMLSKYKDSYFFNSLNESVLRCQSQAVYDNINISHFGLQLKEYCHFTSPIRRYSDLMIHRLILSIIDNQEFDYTKSNIIDICEHISITERIAFNAENMAKDRILTKWLESKIGEQMEGYISSITHAGMFINLVKTGASGLLPTRLISNSFVIIDTSRSEIKDKINKKIYKLGDKITVKLVEANSIKGTITFSLLNN